jgi:Ni/Co efflux regulator RcnB
VKRIMLTLLAASALASPLAGTATAQSKTLTGDTKVVTASIESIERSTRAVTLKQTNGQYVTIVVPRDVAKFDTMKVGDQITARYYDNIVVRVKAPGENATDSDTAGLTATAGAKPGGTAATQRTITATITQLDPKIPSITFTGPNGWKYSSRVQDKDAIKKVKVGDRVDITWTEAVLSSVEPPAKK